MEQGRSNKKRESKMTKKEFAKFAQKRGFTAHYSGRLKKHFLKPTCSGMNIHSLINEK